MQLKRFLVFIAVLVGSWIAVMAGFVVPMLCALFAYSVAIRMAAHLPPFITRFVLARIAAVWLFILSIFAITVLVVLFAQHIVDLSGGWALLGNELIRSGEMAYQALPPNISAYLPNPTEWVSAAQSFAIKHATELGVIGVGAIKTVVYALLGLVIGLLVALTPATSDPRGNPLTFLLFEQVAQLRDAFSVFVRAQVKISLINAILTGLYLVLIMPLIGVHFPFAKTLVLVTFLTGLIPAVGNILSNTVIVLISLTISPSIAAASLVFLVVIHKLEYFINAKLVGESTKSSAWQVLLVMVVAERAFGVAGVLMAPIWLLWMKNEWLLFDAIQQSPQTLTANCDENTERAV